MNDYQFDEGVIKYSAVHEKSGPLAHPFLTQLDVARTELFDLGLIGVYSNGIGYGNVSVRHQSGCIISGTATGAFRILGASRYCGVLAFDIHQNTVHTKGPVAASSESMTHCAIYQANPLIDCVLHIHSRKLWLRLLEEGYPFTSADIPYGTPQMARGMVSLVKDQTMPFGLLVMAGHEEGIVAYGQTILSALNQIKALLELKI
jgi:ribulose-5-phosphate 4-epimerase/fuculose-1-phosphate aldolase